VGVDRRVLEAWASGAEGAGEAAVAVGQWFVMIDNHTQLDSRSIGVLLGPDADRSEPETCCPTAAFQLAIRLLGSASVGMSMRRHLQTGAGEALLSVSHSVPSSDAAPVFTSEATGQPATGAPLPFFSCPCMALARIQSSSRLWGAVSCIETQLI
jgi:hypothetical protein